MAILTIFCAAKCLQIQHKNKYITMKHRKNQYSLLWKVAGYENSKLENHGTSEMEEPKYTNC